MRTTLEFTSGQNVELVMAKESFFNARGAEDPIPRLLRLEDVLARTAMGRTAVYGLIARGAFPSPIKVGRASRWLEGEVLKWIEQLARGRAGAASLQPAAQRHLT